ncbi:MAG: protein YgfX [Halothiobacillus sp.]
MKTETWSAALWPDKNLIRLGWFMQGMAALALGLCGVALNLPLAVSVVMGGVAAVAFVRFGCHRPAVWSERGQLSLAAGRGRWQGAEGGSLDGSLRWLWTGRSLVGLVLVDHEGRQKAHWLTQARMGAIAWGQLQQWLRVANTPALPR